MQGFISELQKEKWILGNKGEKNWEKGQLITEKWNFGNEHSCVTLPITFYH